MAKKREDELLQKEVVRLRKQMQEDRARQRKDRQEKQNKESSAQPEPTQNAAQPNQQLQNDNPLVTVTSDRTVPDPATSSVQPVSSSANSGQSQDHCIPPSAPASGPGPAPAPVNLPSATGISSNDSQIANSTRQTKIDKRAAILERIKARQAMHAAGTKLVYIYIFFRICATLFPGSTTYGYIH